MIQLTIAMPRAVIAGGNAGSALAGPGPTVATLTVPGTDLHVRTNVCTNVRTIRNHAPGCRNLSHLAENRGAIRTVQTRVRTGPAGGAAVSGHG